MSNQIEKTKKKQRQAKSYGLAVFSEGVVAFGASEELRGGFVASSGLYLPCVG